MTLTVRNDARAPTIPRVVRRWDGPNRRRIGDSTKSRTLDGRRCPAKPSAGIRSSTTVQCASPLDPSLATSGAVGAGAVAVMESAAVTDVLQQQPMNDCNVLEWMQSSHCPVDVVPLIFTYCGPRQTYALSRTNTKLHALVSHESTWRTMCEGLYKWKVGDPEPDSWFDLYRTSPCVPVDYRTIPQALALAAEQPPVTHATHARFWHSSPSNKTPVLVPQVRSIRILLRPGKYYLKQAIQVQAPPGVTISLETMELPARTFCSLRHQIMEQPLPVVETTTVLTTTHTKRGPSFRNLFRCHRTEPTEETDVDETECTDEIWDHASTHKNATLVLRSKLTDEPAFRIQQGVVRLKNLDIQHNSPGHDIWNGNAAVQIQPPLDDEHNQPLTVDPRPTASLHRVHISSQSGRGIVNIDGGHLSMTQCAVTDCAATGVYVGGPGSVARLDRTDVIRNGVGNATSRRGIARGHSGVYLEQGLATIRHSNVSFNTLTGISVVSPDNALLTLDESTLVGNGTYQLELPALGSASRRRSTNTNNTLAHRGEARSRSGLIPSAHARAHVVLNSDWIHLPRDPSILPAAFRIPPHAHY